MARSTSPDNRWPAATTVQSILFDKQLWTPAQAKAWAKKNKKRYGKVDVGKGQAQYIRLRQVDPGKFVPGTLRTMTWSAEKGVKAVVGALKASWPRGVARPKVSRMAAGSKLQWTRHSPDAWAGQRQPYYTARTPQGQFVIRPEGQRWRATWQARGAFLRRDPVRGLQRQVDVGVYNRLAEAKAAAERKAQEWRFDDQTGVSRMPTHQPSSYSRMPAAASSGSLTLDEFITLGHSMANLIPAWNGVLFEKLVRKKATLIEQLLPQFSQTLAAVPEKLADKATQGVVLPARFLPAAVLGEPSKEQILAEAQRLFQMMMQERAA